MRASATVTPGSGGWFVMYADAGYTNQSNITDTAPGLQVIYIVHQALACATAGQFMMVNNGYTATWMSDDYLGNLAIGNSQTGLALSYGANVATPYPMVNVTYMNLGTSGCTGITMAPDPREPDGIIAATDCQFLKYEAQGSVLCVNGSPAGGCGLCASSSVSGCCPVPVKGSTWSRLKALYRR